MATFTGLWIYYCPEAIRRLMHKLGLIVKVFSHHTTKYSSYRGTVGKIAPNRLHQIFHQYWPYKALHTDITQINMMNHRCGYISAIVNEATKEVLSMSISLSPNMNLVFDTLKHLKHAIPNGIKTILHSDQGWQYQMPEYRHTLKKMNLIQSMSRNEVP